MLGNKQNSDSRRRWHGFLEGHRRIRFHRTPRRGRLAQRRRDRRSAFAGRIRYRRRRSPGDGGAPRGGRRRRQLRRPRPGLATREPQWRQCRRRAQAGARLPAGGRRASRARLGARRRRRRRDALPTLEGRGRERGARRRWPGDRGRAPLARARRRRRQRRLFLRARGIADSAAAGQGPLAHPAAARQRTQRIDRQAGAATESAGAGRRRGAGIDHHRRSDAFLAGMAGVAGDGAAAAFPGHFEPVRLGQRNRRNGARRPGIA